MTGSAQPSRAWSSSRQRRREWPQGRRRRGGGPRITGRDLEILRWLGRVRFASREQVARRFCLGRSQSFHRLAQLRKVGFLDERALVVGRVPGIVFAARRGLAAAGSDLGPADLDNRTFGHDLALVDLTIDYELGGATVLTDPASCARSPAARRGRQSATRSAS